jgi:hypothetical protein
MLREINESHPVLQPPPVEPPEPPRAPPAYEAPVDRWEAPDDRGGFWGWVDRQRERALDAVLDRTFDLSSKLDSLKPGDSWRVGGKAEGGLAVVVKGEIELEVKRNDDDTYTVKTSGAGGAGPGVKLADLTGGVGDSVEYRFDSLEDAKQATQALLKTPAGASPHELETLYRNVSAIELTGAVTGEADARFGLAGVNGGGLEGKLQLAEGRRVEIENGEPVAIVHTYEWKGDAALENSRLYEDLPQGTLTADGSYRVEVRTPLTGPVAGDNLPAKLATLVRHPDSVPTGTPVTDVHFAATFRSVPTEDGREPRGRQLEVHVEGIDPTRFDAALPRLARGDLAGAARATGIEVDGDWRAFTDVGAEGEVDVIVAAAGGRNVVRRFDEAQG